METLRKLYEKASKSYNKLTPHNEFCLDLVLHCQRKLKTGSKFRAYGNFNGIPRIPYSVFALGDSLSRPVRSDLYFANELHFRKEYDHILKILQQPGHRWTNEDRENANRVVYTAVMSFACCIDLWQRKSRKTPGTFFEVYMAGILQTAFPEAVFSKHISLEDLLGDREIGQSTSSEAKPDDESSDKASVSTDVVISVPDRAGGIVIPLKITTRERIVQPFAHQRILDAAFGEGRYKSLIVCISETQLDDKTQSVKQVCVPGTIKLFQKYLAPVTGLYYCDLPQRYVAKDMTGIIAVRSVGHLFEDLRAILH